MTPLNNSDQKKCRQNVNPAANFNSYDGVNIRCVASNRKSAVAIDNLHRVNDGDDHTGKLS